MLEQSRESQRESGNREELLERMAHQMPEDGMKHPLPGLRLSRVSVPGECVFGMTEPSVCIIAQGSKSVSVGDKVHRYDPYHYLLGTVELPVMSRITAASKEKPYLGFRLTLDPSLVGAVMVEIGQSTIANPGAAKAIEVSPLDSSLLDAILRLVRLIDCPTEARVLQASVTREIVYRLLTGAQSHLMQQMTVMGGHTHRIAKAVDKICREYDQPLRVEDMARQIGMSVSGFHHHFKSVTAMTPLQFQKQLRLREARRLMLDEELDAASAGSKVGYDDASYFNREYKSLFGAPPRRDIEGLREAVSGRADLLNAWRES